MSHYDDMYDKLDRIEDEKKAKREEQTAALMSLSLEKKIDVILNDLLASKTNIEISKLYRKHCENEN